MVPKPLIFVAVLAISVSAQYGVAGMYENLPLESTTVESSGDGSGAHDAVGNDNGFATGADAIAIDTDCSTKEDGLYAIGGCSPQFLTCSGGIARIMDCPANLIYDHRIVACEYSYNVPECGGAPQDVTSTQSAQYVPVTEETTTTPEEVTVPVETTVNPYAAPEPIPTSTTPAADVTAVDPYVSAGVPTTEAPAEDVPVTRAASDRTCGQKPDGFYSFGECSDHYIACSNGYTIPMQCPASLAFDEARVICDYTMNVPECQNNSGNDDGSAEETSTEASGELPYSNGNGYEETTTAGQDVPSTEGYVSDAQPYVQYEVQSTTAADVPTTTVGYVEETTSVADTPSTTEGYAPEVLETTAATYTPTEETTTAADVPSTTVGYVPEIVETTTVVEETTTAADVPSTTAGYFPEVSEITTAEEPSTTAGYVPEVVETTSAIEETTTVADVPSTTVGYAPVVIETTPALQETTTTVANDVPACTEGASAIEPCSQRYNNCVNGQETVFFCETGLFFSPEQKRCTTADQIVECQQSKPYY